MASHTTSLSQEFDAFAAPLVESGRYANPSEVLHAAMDALLLAQVGKEAVDRALIELAEEGEASGVAEGDVFEDIRQKYGLGQFR